MNAIWKHVLGIATLAASMQVGAVGRLVDLAIVDRATQQELPVYRHEGRYYVAGHPGHRYQIRLRSQDDSRLLGVLSVDGVNALSGDAANWTQEGYVLSPFESSDILGWRKSLSEVADFVFADASRSYAARTGRPDNVGVIGIAVFLPRRMIRPLPMPMAPATPAPDAMRSDAPAAPRMAEKAAAPAAEALASARDNGPIGTGHGERETSVVSYTDFQRASSTPNEVITLYYDTRERLIAQGVIPGDDRPTPRPDPFPGHFVPDPR
ncbi:hypothetical protein [Dyella sp. C11]|uniref:hypothetical protein n=1 Tax=Dyella sp. C11 TaxID=2126991 RepID=UPI000D65191C|nr:hypothetical protein [Dyella sp. C11]